MQVDNLVLLKPLQMLIKATGLRTVIAADWQAEPHELDSTGWLQQVQLQAVAPEVVATCTTGRGRVIDYYVVSKCLLAAAAPPMLIPWFSDQGGLIATVP